MPSPERGSDLGTLKPMGTWSLRDYDFAEAVALLFIMGNAGFISSNRTMGFVSVTLRCYECWSTLGMSM